MLATHTHVYMRVLDYVHTFQTLYVLGTNSEVLAITWCEKILWYLNITSLCLYSVKVNYFKCNTFIGSRQSQDLLSLMTQVVFSICSHSKCSHPVVMLFWKCEYAKGELRYCHSLNIFLIFVCTMPKTEDLVSKFSQHTSGDWKCELIIVL